MPRLTTAGPAPTIDISKSGVWRIDSTTPYAADPAVAAVALDGGIRSGRGDAAGRDGSVFGRMGRSAAEPHASRLAQAKGPAHDG